ncbi:MAG: electron transfer flavoprotein subunit alpha, partial [Coxiella sp. (in: Bacteria)]
MTTLIIVEHNNQKVRATTLAVLAAATQIEGTISALVMGYNCQPVVDELKQYGQIDTIHVANHACYEHQLAENTAQLVQSVANDYTHIFAPSTTFGKNLLPRVAALMDIGQLSDVIAIIDAKTYKRPIYAGNAIATVESSDAIQLATIRPSAFDRVSPKDGDITITNLETTFDNKHTQFVSETKQVGDRPELASADVIISGGRGLGDKATFDRLIAIADKMGAAVGASRAAV